MDTKRLRCLFAFPLTMGLVLISHIVYAGDLTLVNEFHEHYSQEVPVSGNVIAGIELHSSNQKHDGFAPHIYMPESLNGIEYLCFQVLSRDGTYNSRNTYQVPETAVNQGLSVDYSQSKHLGFLKQQVSSGTLAVKASLGHCSESKGTSYFAINKSKSNESHGDLRIYLDSLGATDVKLAARGKNKKVIRANCQSLQGKRLTGFDYVCSLPASKFEKSTLDVQIVRFKHKRKLDNILIKVIL